MPRRVATPGAAQHATTGMLGGVKQMGSSPGRRTFALGDEAYLWLLVIAEVAAISWARSAFSRYHGG